MKAEKIKCYIPIEVKSRELDTKIYMSLKLIDKGYSVVIGSKSQVHKNMFLNKGPFIYFDKGISESSFTSNFYKAIRASGGLIIEIQEEGNVSKNSDVLISAHNNSNAKMVSLIFTWGDLAKKKIIESCPKLNPENIISTGHPSMDLLQKDLIFYYKKLGNNKLKIKPGYILINTNFAHFNGYANFEESKIYNDNPTSLYNNFKRDEWLKVEKYQKRIFNEFLKMIRILNKSLPKKKIIIRPHPVENLQFYKTEFKNYKNIYVTNEGSVREWIVNSEFVIHHDCTSGLESFIAGKKVISFCPILNGKIVAKLPIDLSLKFEKTKDLTNYIKDEYKNSNNQLAKNREAKIEYLKKFIKNVEEKSADIIVNNLLKLNDNLTELKFSSSKKLFFLGKLFFAKSFKYLFTNNKIKKKLRYRQKKKFSSLNKNEISRRIEILNGIVLNKKKVKINELAKNLFLLTN